MAMYEGFKLTDDELEEATSALRDLEACWITAAADSDEKTNVYALEGLVRLFQLGLEVQNHDYNDLAEEHQNVKDESQVLQEEMQEFQRAMEEDEETREKLLSQKEDDLRKIEDLEKRLNMVQEDMEKKTVEVEDLAARLKDAQQDNEDMRNEAHMMSLQRQASDLPGELKLRDALKHKDWEIDRLMRDNKDLERANQDLRDELDELKTENYEVSSKIVTLDEEGKHLHVRALDLEEEIDKLNASNADLVAERDSLDTQLKDKMHLLEEFELRFHKQFNAWEDEKKELLQQIETQRADLDDSDSRVRGLDASRLRDSRDSIESQEITIQVLRRELEEGKEKEILLLEAYEQLEKDVGKEVERALQKHGKDSEKFTERNRVLEEAMGKAREQIDALEGGAESLQLELEDAKERNRVYEEGVYGLPQAVQEIKDLKGSLLKSEDRQQELVERINKVSDRLEDVVDENRELRKRANIHEDEAIDISDIKLEKEAIISQLRSLTSQLESEVWGLEEERRKLKTELRFRAKYHGRHALDMGLTPEQLLMAEHYVEKLKHGDGGKNAEIRMIEDMNKRVRFLEDRLAAFQAFGELPAGMRPMLLEDDSSSENQNLIEERILNPIDEAIQKLTAIVEQQGEHQHNFDERSAASVLQLLAQASESALRFSELKIPRQAPSAAVNTPLLLTHGKQEDLHAKHRALQEELGSLQIEVAKKDAQLEIFQRHGASINVDPQPQQEQNNDSVPKEQYNDLVVECAGLKEQLITVMEESSQNASLYERLVENCRKYQKQMQGWADQRSILYRDHTQANEQWRDEKLHLENKVHELEGKVSALETTNSELEQGIDRLASGANDEVRDSYADAIRKMAIVQMKHAKSVREVEFCRQVESHLQQRCTTLDIFAQEADALYRPRIKYLAYLNDRAQTKVDELEKQLEDTIPAREFSDLQRRHMVLERSHRELVEDFANESTEAQKTESYKEESAKWMEKYMTCADKTAEMQEELRQLKLMFGNGDKAAIESQLNREVVDLVIREQSAARQADMSDRAKERAEAGLRDAEDRMRGLEERIGKLHSELECAHRTEEDLRRVLSESIAKEKYDEQCKRLQHLEKKCLDLEYQNSASMAESGDIQNKVSMLERTLKQRQGEIIGLRSALREASSRNETSSLLAKLQLEVEHIRAREAVVKHGQLRAEQAKEAICSEFENVLKAKAESEAQLVALKGELRQVTHDRLKTLRKLDDTRAGLIQQWKAEMWARTLKQLRNQNKALEAGLKSARGRVMHLEERVDRSQLEQEASNALREIQNAPLPEVHKELLKSSEDIIELKLARSRLERAEMLTKEQVGYVEKVNADLRGVLDRIDQEALQHQTLMESEMRECQAARCKTEDLLIQLRQEHEVLQNEVHSSSAKQQHHEQLDPAGNSTNAADREIMLRQIEGVKEARIQAETFRQKCGELEEQLLLKEMQLQAMQRDQQDLLERLEQGSLLLSNADENGGHGTNGQTVALAQIQAFAENAMRDLRSQLAAKNGQMKILRSQLESDRQTYLKQHDLDRKEIQKLGDRLLEHKHANIQTLRSSLSQPFPRANAPLKEAVSEDGESDGGSYEQLKHLLQEREARIAFLAAQVDEVTAKLSSAKSDHQHQLLLKEQELDGLKNEVEEARNTLQCKDLQKSWREGERKLKLQLSAKDVKLRHLKEAIKALEEKLVEALKKNADEVMYESSWREQEKLIDQMTAIKAEKNGLEKDLEVCRKQAAQLKEAVQEKDAEIERLRKNLDKEVASTSNLGSKLNKERANRRATTISRDKEDEVAKAGLAEELERKLNEAEKRIAVLQEHNKKLRNSLQELEEQGEKARNTEGVANSNSTASQLLSKQKVQHWEEAKRLQKKVETLRAQVNKKNQDLVQATKEMEKWQAKVTQLQSETTKQSALVQSLKEQLQKAKITGGARRDLAKVEECVENMDRIEQKNHELELENALLKRQLIELQNETEEGGAKKEGMASMGKRVEKTEEDVTVELLQKEEELFESRLRRDQAEAQVKRLKQTLKDFFGSEDGSGVPVSGHAKSSKKMMITSAREEELLTTINTLRKALERSQQGVPISKHRQVVEKRKELQKKVEELSERCSQLRDPKEDVKQLERRCEELQTSNLVLRRQVAKFQDASVRLEEAEGQRKQKETENAALRKALAQLEERIKEDADHRELEKSEAAVEEIEGGTSSLEESSEVMQALKDRVVELELENQDLRKELDGFDPTFFEEIEDLKHEHHQLSQKVVHYEQLISQMREEPRR
ncbi:hypothetical protein BSKO_08697 [Bryopsis sp. KO-2023]|nr:hypothetical protein BSKO_08697 [Bryopsis sp. KO-2023]